VSNRRNWKDPDQDWYRYVRYWGAGAKCDVRLGRLFIALQDESENSIAHKFD
jgi:hypothetical protein